MSFVRNWSLSVAISRITSGWVMLPSTCSMISPLSSSGIAELAVEKQAHTLLLPVSARRHLNDLPDDLWTKIGIEFYRDATDAVFKALVD